MAAAGERARPTTGEPILLGRARGSQVLAGLLAALASRRLHSPATRYAAAVAAVLCGALLVWVGGDRLTDHYQTIFYAAVALSAFLGGFGPGVLASLLAVVLLGILSAMPLSALVPSHWTELAPLLAFLAVSAVISAFSAALRVSLADAERRAAVLEALFESMPDGVLVGGRDGMSMANGPALMQLGYEASADVRQHVSVLLDELQIRYADSGERVALGDDVFSRALRGDNASRDIIVRNRRTGQDRLIHVRAVPVVAGRQVVAAAAVTQDVTEDRQRELALRESEQRYRALVEAASQMVWTVQGDGAFATEAPAWGEFTGQSWADARGWGWLSAVHPEDRARVQSTWDHALATGIPYETTYRLRHRDGGYRYTSVRAAPVRNADGTVREWVGTNTDVTERHQLLQRERAARAEAEQAAARAARLQAVTAALSSATTPAEVARVILAEAAASVGASAGVVYRLSVDGTTLSSIGATGYEHTFQARWGTLDVADETGAGHAVRTREAVWLRSREERAAAFPHLMAIAEFAAFHAWAVLPLVIGERAIGALSLVFGDPQSFDADERRLLSTIADQCAQALDRAESYVTEREARVEAEAANRAKSTFLAVMSHELRTPLNAIIGYTELIADEVVGPLNETQRSQLGRVKASARHLVALIEDVLALSRIEAGKEQLHLERVDAGELARESAALVAPAAAAKGLAYDVDVPRDAVWMETDPTKARQILINLLSNAVKFTEQGSVQLRLRTLSGMVEFEVRDTGMGIAPKYHERIFEAFWQAEQSRTRRASGTGLGLSVTRQLARLLGGEVRVVSEERAGTVFSVRLPAESAARLPGGRHEPRATGHAPSERNI